MMAAKTTKQMLEEQGRVMEMLAQVVAGLAEGQSNLTQQLNDQLRDLNELKQRERGPEDSKAATKIIMARDTSADDKADARSVAESPIVEVYHDEDDAKVIGFNSQPRIVVTKGKNYIPQVYANIYNNYKEDVAFRDWNAKRMQVPDNTKGPTTDQLDLMLVQGKRGA